MIDTSPTALRQQQQQQQKESLPIRDSSRHEDPDESIMTNNPNNNQMKPPSSSSAASSLGAVASSHPTDNTTTTIPATTSLLAANRWEQDPVLASLSKRSAHPYSAVSLSPTRQFAVTACHDAIQIISIGGGGSGGGEVGSDGGALLGAGSGGCGTGGLSIVKTIPLAPHVAIGCSTSSGTATVDRHRPLRITEDLFEEPGSRPRTSPQDSNNSSTTTTTTVTAVMNVVVNDVAWSNQLLEGTTSHHHNSRKQQQQQQLLQLQNVHNNSQQQPKQFKQAFIAAAGSNGSIVVWREETLLQQQQQQQQQQPNGTQQQQQQSLAPEVVLNQHTRAVNRLAWHPKRQMLLSASHDTTVRLWERKRDKSDVSNSNNNNNKVLKRQGFSFPFFGDFQGSNRQGNEGSANKSAPATFTWHCMGVFEPRCESVRDVGWNPMAEDIFALCTSNGSLIVYNRFVQARNMVKLNAHDRDATSLHWHPTRPYTIATGGSNDRLVKVWNLEQALALDHPPLTATTTTMDHSNNTTMAMMHLANNQNTSSSNQTDISDVSTDSTLSVGSRASTAALTFCSTSSISRQPPEHVLAVAAPVKRVRWRPAPAVRTPTAVGMVVGMNRTLHAPTSVSSERQHIPLFQETKNRHDSMLAVATLAVKGESGGGSGFVALWSYLRPYMPLSIVEGHKEGAVTDLTWLDSPSRSSLEDEERMLTTRHNAGHWQHILSVGKDGQCLIQSLAKGERPIANVPSSCFAMANLSPFQRGYGSLQFFSVHQQVNRDFDSWLRSEDGVDATESLAPATAGMVRPRPFPRAQSRIVETEISPGLVFPSSDISGTTNPTITFYSLDRGDLDQTTGKPAISANSIMTNNDTREGMVIAPEVVHLSRFADQYVLYPTLDLPTLNDICRHNQEVAKSLQNDDVAQMWRTIETELRKCVGVDTLVNHATMNASSSKDDHLWPIILAILEERADQGDVQSCVAVCEVLQIVNADRTTAIPNLPIQLVREWYLSYIDLLRSMCLFAHASDVIRNCRDPFVNAQNRQSTTFSESCQRCGKPVWGADRRSAMDPNQGLARLTCQSCQSMIATCSICQEPVRGMFVWCPGCGHGGHLEHLMGWFSIRQECPTGCGHLCNMLRTVNAFPRSSSMRELDKLDISMNSG